jgi:hypothetical protein
MKTRVSVKVDIWTEDITENFSAAEMVKIYGKSEILSCFTIGELLQHFDADDFLNAIGDEKIAEYFKSYIESKEIA